MSDLFLHQGLRTRWASPENPAGAPGAAHRGDDGRKRRPCYPLKPGESSVLAEASGTSGTIRRIWITIRDRSAAMLRGMRLRMTWDGAATPAVDAPLGDFFCQGLGRMAAFENELFSSPEGRSFVSVVPMPFRTGMRIELVNETEALQEMVFYDVDYTLGDVHGPDALYFHAHWRRERPTTMYRDFAILPQLAGRGRFLGAMLSVIPDTVRWGRTWWGEGELKAWLDGDGANPTLCGTGTEDWIGTGWAQGQYAHRFQGCPVADHQGFRFAFYRLNVPDPIFFSRDIRVTMQQIGWTGPNHNEELQRLGTRIEHGHKPIDMAAMVRDQGKSIFEREDDWAACAWFYLDRPENGLPALATVAERTIGL